jgi:hypothetical protein
MKSPPQTKLQALQLYLSLEVSTHAPLQQDSPVGHWVLFAQAAPHVPLLQTCPLGHWVLELQVQ